ncbi:MAG: SMC-Scp complex subunit ScpB [Gammaproteobacteria bacterium]
MTNENPKPIKLLIESGLMAAGEPLSFDRIQELFPEENRPNPAELSEALSELKSDYEDRSIELKELATGYCFRVREAYSESVVRLWQERPTRYSRAILETMAIIAYKQPVTRGDIEKIRGVAVSTTVIKTLQDRGWIRTVGHRDVPGKPTLYATTKDFLDYFSLKSLEELPPLAEVQSLEQMEQQLELNFTEAIEVPMNIPAVTEAMDAPVNIPAVTEAVEVPMDIPAIEIAGEQ